MNRAISFAFICVLIAGIVNANSFLDTKSQLSEDIAQFAVDEMGAGHTLISIQSIERKINNGIIYHLHITVREYMLGGFDTTLNCHVIVRVKGFANTVQYNSCS